MTMKIDEEFVKTFEKAFDDKDRVFKFLMKDMIFILLILFFFVKSC